jgi:hypothetical protein
LSSESRDADGEFFYEKPGTIYKRPAILPEMVFTKDYSAFQTLLRLLCFLPFYWLRAFSVDAPGQHQLFIRAALFLLALISDAGKLK